MSCSFAIAGRQHLSSSSRTKNKSLDLGAASFIPPGAGTSSLNASSRGKQECQCSKE